MSRKTVTLTADAELYDAAKTMGISPSQLLDVALKTVIGAAVDEDWQMVLRVRVIEEQLRKVEDNRRMLVRQMEELKEKLKALEQIEQRLKRQLEDIRLEQRLTRLQQLVQKLRRLAEVYAFDEEAMMRDEDVCRLVDEIRQLKPDFELGRYVQLWKVMSE